MSDLTTITLTFTVVCVVIAAGVWLLARSKSKANQGGAEQIGHPGDRSSDRRPMQARDWINATFTFAIGVMLGIAFFHMAQLETAAFWLTAITLPVLFGGVLLFDSLLNRLGEMLFPSGIRPARKTAGRRRGPLLRLLSMPIGVVCGVGLTWIGLDGALLGLL